MLKIFTIAVLALFITSCSNNQSQDTKNDVDSHKEVVKKDAKQYSLNEPTEIIQAFKDSGLPIGKVVIHTSASDPNKLLGRPDGYIALVHFEDKSVEQNVPLTENEEVLHKGGVIEVWKSSDEAESRMNYISDVVKQMNIPALKQYMYRNKGVVLRLEYDVLPEQAAKYEAVLISL
ncbi:hypothetical protein [Psychrobacter sanguinis]|uniref:hypothetical protein n=1 Tax=Psychrobacter sanguinis TaxID=861445 RepID=UPI002A7498FD|nr:hypothetical protein [Psychrobacter sanguinis]MDY3305510.1 hypothetical protein [Psychrobacter sanguinis]